ncbi:MAG TPA: hypothetical protein VNL14_13990 [Candidatus Acidoferrales bacterium]|nr:hypothetical protein [Candidatus Acidoferrales bacterium]
MRTRELLSNLIRSFLIDPDYSYRFLRREVKLAERKIKLDLIITIMERVMQIDADLSGPHQARFRRDFEVYLNKYTRRQKKNARTQNGGKILSNRLEATKGIER